MLSPLKPLLCRHVYYWSERHQSERCRRCGKLGAEGFHGGAGRTPFRESPATLRTPAIATPTTPPPLRRPGAEAQLGVDARSRRKRLVVLLDALVRGDRPTREDAIDAVLAVIEDAHSADPVLFGSQAAAEFARLHEARRRIAEVAHGCAGNAGEAMVPATGIEPVTFGLQNRCSTS